MAKVSVTHSGDKIAFLFSFGLDELDLTALTEGDTLVARPELEQPAAGQAAPAEQQPPAPAEQPPPRTAADLAAAEQQQAATAEQQQAAPATPADGPHGDASLREPNVPPAEPTDVRFSPAQAGTAEQQPPAEVAAPANPPQPGA